MYDLRTFLLRPSRLKFRAAQGCKKGAKQVRYLQAIASPRAGSLVSLLC